MKPLPQTFTARGERGWSFTILERVADVVLVRKVHPEVPRAFYEVAIVQKHPTYTIGGATVEAHEAMPGAEAFGRHAWAPSSLAAARDRFEALTREGGTPARDGTEDALSDVQRPDHAPEKTAPRRGSRAPANGLSGGAS